MFDRGLTLECEFGLKRNTQLELCKKMDLDNSREDGDSERG